MATLRFYWNVLKNAIWRFSEDDIFAYSGALSYYTIFSLPPILLIILHVAKLFYDETSVKGVLFSQIESIIGYDGAQQVMAAIGNIQVFEPTLWATLLSIGVLIFTSTSVLVTMQSALNKIFNVKSKPQGSGLLKMVRDRAISLTLLIGFAFILLLSLVVDSIITAFSTYLEDWFGGINIALTLFTSMMLSFLITTLFLASIFKFLPDAILKWKYTWFGAILTSLLFSLGKYLISFYIGNSNIGGLYDAAGNIMVIMAWIFYTSLIFMFGAIFTYTRVIMMGESIPASDYAIKIKQEDTGLHQENSF